MKNDYLRRISLAFLMTLVCATVSYAYDFKVDGIYYNITSESDYEVEVTYRENYKESYSGDIVIPESVTYNGITYSVTTIGDRAFYRCGDLTSIEIPNSVMSIGENAFYVCENLTSIDIPNSVTSIGEGAFFNCRSLTSIDIPNSVMSIGKKAFYYCESLTSIKIPNDVTSIGDRTFYYCSSLISVTIGDGCTSIGEGAFSECSSLTNVTIGSGVMSIGDYAFSYCTSLTDIYSQNETPPTCYDSDVFSSSTYSDATLHVSSTALSAYQTTSPWSLFYSIVDNVTGIEDMTIQDYSIRASDGVITVSGVSGTVYVYSINGKKVAEATADGGTTGIRISHHGVYIVKIYDGKSSVTQKVII